MRGIRRVSSHDSHRNFTVLHKSTAMHTLHEAAAGTLWGFLPVAIRTRSGRIAIQTKRFAHLLFGVIHWRRRRGGWWLFPRQAHALALVRLRFQLFVVQVDHPVRLRNRALLIDMHGSDSQVPRTSTESGRTGRTRIFSPNISHIIVVFVVTRWSASQL